VDDDLVALVRRECNCQFLSWKECPCLACRAADEIERLRAEVRKCHRLNGWSKSKGWWCACGEWSLRRNSTDPFERPWDYRPTEAHGEHVDALLAAATPQEADTSWLDDRSDRPCDYCSVPDGDHTIDELRSCHADLEARARQQGTDFR
jgi:hypothetical protein